MKEISYEKAKALIEKGEPVKCQTGNRVDQYEIVHSVLKLNALYQLSKERVQLCKLYQIPQTKKEFTDDELELDFDEAYKTVVSGERIFYKNKDGEEDEITTISELVNLRRASEARGKKLILYWHE